MCKLNGSFGVLTVDEVCDAFERHNLAVFPKTRVLGTDTPTGLNSSSFNENKTSTLEGKLSEMDKMEIC
jgi:hypothetical protein